VELRVAIREMADERGEDVFRINARTRRGFDRRGVRAQVRRVGTLTQVDADAEDARAPRLSLDGFGEDAAEFSSFEEDVVRPLDVCLKRARFRERVAHGEGGHERQERPRLRTQARAQDDAEIESRIRRRHPHALLPPAPARLLARHYAQAFGRTARRLTRRLRVGRGQRVVAQDRRLE
jgi:hypothetical protein